MWKAQVGHAISGSSSLAKKILAENENDPDDWDTDPDFVVILFQFSQALSKLDLYLYEQNTVSEKEQRWGSKTIQGSGRMDSVK